MSYTTDIVSNLQSTLSTQAINRLEATPDHRAAVTSTAAQRTAVTAPAKSDQASLSRESVLLSHALALPDVRANKVAALQQSIAAGTYQVSSADVAGKLLDALQS